jgi:tetratricopeptide (TPR) repeat protein
MSDVGKLAIWLCAAGLAAAQPHPAGPPEKPPALIPGLGTWHHRIATRSAEAQKFFDQGLNLLYGFNRYEALRSFRKASELDPKAAMPHWGVAMAQSPHINMDLDGDVDLKAGCAALEEGRQLATEERERAYLAAAATRCPEYQPDKYSAAMWALTQRYPDDLDALTFYAESLMIPVRWHWYTPDGAPAAGVAEAEHTLESIMRRWPEHPGANHFYIHAVESSRTPERAIPSAQRLMGIVPSAGHLVHMPGHIWLVLGEYEMAATVNERAAEVDRRYLDETHVAGGSYIGYYIHNLHFVTYARWMQGRSADSIAAADRMAEAVGPVVQMMAEMIEPFLGPPIFSRLRAGAWDQILKLPQPAANLTVTNAVWRYGRALALAAKGDAAGAARERDGFEAARAKVPADRLWINSKTADVLAMASEIVAARTAGSPADAIPHWERTVTAQDALAYDEPPPWYYPVRESLGAALLRAGRKSDAEAVFREGIRRSPRNGRMLFGLMESLKAQNKTEAAEAVRREYEAAWAKADVKLRIEDL